MSLGCVIVCHLVYGENPRRFRSRLIVTAMPQNHHAPTSAPASQPHVFKPLWKFSGVSCIHPQSFQPPPQIVMLVWRRGPVAVCFDFDQD